MVGKKAPLSQKEARKRNDEIRAFLLEHKDEVKDVAPGFSLDELAQQFGVTKKVIRDIEGTLRENKSLHFPERDPFVVPTDEFEGQRHLRRSQRAAWIKKYHRRPNWDRERLRQKLGFKSIDALRVFARENNIKLKPRERWPADRLQTSKRAQDEMHREIREWLSARIAEGALVDPKVGVNKLYELAQSTFAERLKTTQMPFQKADFPVLLDEVIWTSDVIKELREAIRNRLDLDDFRVQYFARIPKGLWEEKIKYFRGLAEAHLSSKFIAGVGRLITDDLEPKAENFTFPPHSASSPIEIDIGKADGSDIPVINGAHIGTLFDPNIEDNPLRRACADSEKRKAPAVILTNLVDLINIKKTAGVGHIYRAQVSGIHVKVDHLPEHYREDAAAILKNRPNDKVVYQSIAVRFIGVLDGLWKIFHRKDNKNPEFTGKILYVLGYKEEELINEAANAEIRYIQRIDEERLETEISTIKRHIAQALKHEDYEEVERLEARQGVLVEQLAMTILTNVSDEDRNFHRKRMRALFVSKIESVIPNCTVVSQGDAYFKLGSKTVKIHIPRRVPVTDRDLANYNYGFEVFTDTLADLTIICAPYSLNHRMIGREDSKDGGVPVTKFIHVAPMLIDDEYIREQLRDATKEVHPVQKCVNSPQFRPGMLSIRCAGDLLNAHAVPIVHLDRSKALLKTNNFAYPYPETSYILAFLNTDNHFGDYSKRYIWDPKQRIHLGTAEAAIEMFRQEGLLNDTDCPFHLTAEMDDASSGDMWFAPRYRPEPRRMSIMQFERWQNQVLKDIERASERRDMKTVRKLTGELSRISIYQLYRRGEDFPFHQMMEVFDRHLTPNVDFYSAVLGRFVKSGLTFRTMSEFHGELRDTRDGGVHNFPNGNHRIKSLEQKDLEGDYMAMKLQDKLLQLPQWQKYEADNPGFMERAIRSPRFGNTTFGACLMKSPSGFEWMLRILASPAKQSGWNDILGALVKNDLQRGDDTYGLMKYPVVTLLGDKHQYEIIETALIKYVMCAAGVHTSQYGSVGGFPPNNTGPCVVCIPADGFDAGPLLMIPIPHDFLRDWFANPKPFNAKKIFPKPL